MGAMQSMELQSLGWGPDQLSILAEALPFAKELRKLVLDYNPAGPKGAAVLAKTLPHCQRLQRLDMKGTQRCLSARTVAKHKKRCFVKCRVFVV